MIYLYIAYCSENISFIFIFFFCGVEIIFIVKLINDDIIRGLTAADWHSKTRVLKRAVFTNFHCEKKRT